MTKVARLSAGVLVLAFSSGAPLGAQKVSRVRPGARTATRSAAAGVLTAAERNALVRVALVEDARALGTGGVEVLRAATEDASPVVRRAAVRALGRLQRPDQLEAIEATLTDPEARVRVEAANAIGQALQGLRTMAPDDGKRRDFLDAAVDALVRTAERHPDPVFLGVAARTLGRLPFADSVVPREVERVLVEMGDRTGGGKRALVRSDARVAMGIMHGLYGLARARRQTGAPSTAALAAMRWATSFGTDSGGTSDGKAIAGGTVAGGTVTGGSVESNAQVRRIAWLGLIASGDTSAALVRRASRDADEQVRRLGVVAAAALRDDAARREVIAASLHDPSFLVRFEGVRAYRTLPGPRSCAPLLLATKDANPHVMLAAIDALGAACDDKDKAAEALRAIVDADNVTRSARSKGETSWHKHARALAALAHVAPGEAIPLLRRDARHPLWQVRLYVARAAAVVRDTLTLTSLAYDSSGNVREAALAGISATIGHVGDQLFTAALASNDYQVVLAAATALQGAPVGATVVPALFSALERITAEQRETSRDPRIALLGRIGELGGARDAGRLAPFTSDFDSTVARRAATIMERWTLRRVVATPRPLSPPSEPLSTVIGSELRLMVKMSAANGGGSFVVRLNADEAPLTVARIVRLARSGYYAGLTFHRVEPAFVIQGGSPAASEYVGDAPFMRDELGLASHLRGTLGVSTRGRDTGDAQLFVNLADNFRLDHDYTVFGEIIQGREVAEGVLEGDVIERVDVVRVR